MATPISDREQYLERPLPNSPESERAILGSIMLDNSHLSRAVELLKPDDFYSMFHRRVFSGMINLFNSQKPVDPIMIGEELKKEGVFESSGGVAAISNLMYGLPQFANIDSYAGVVLSKATNRNLIKTCNLIVNEALAEEDESEIILDRAEQRIFALADARTKTSFAHVKPVADGVMVKVQEYSQRKDVNALTGLTTGFRDLDSMTSGMQSTDLIIVAARPSMGKCLSADSEILLANGKIKTIEEICRQKHAKLLTLQDNFKFTETTSSNFIDDGIKPVFRVTTGLGRKIETTSVHPFLTVNGWQKLESLKIGEKVAVPRILDIFGNDEMRDCEVKLLAYLLGDGGLTRSSPIFTVGNPFLKTDFEQSAAEFGGVETVAANSADRTFSLRIRQIGGRSPKPNPLTTWLKKLGIYGLNSHRKFIPGDIFSLKREQVSLFLNRLFATDGWASVLQSGQTQLGFASVSERMIRQIQHLLLRFGVIANLKKRSVKYRDERRTAWQLDITDALSIKTFMREIGIFGKEDVIEKVEKSLENRRYQTNKDLIPLEIWKTVQAEKGAESWASLGRRANIQGCTNLHVGKRALSRKRLSAFAEALNSENLQNLAASEIYWDEIVSIEYAGEKQVYDLTIPETHNFVANDICVHNTSLCLTIAQNAALKTNAVVAFYSLEMSKEQLVMRMLCSEAHVDAHRFRTGYLAKDEWARLAEALGRLSAAGIYIDDTAGISVLEMRAKARRLAAEKKKLDLIVVDYLQLMSGSSQTQ